MDIISVTISILLLGLVIALAIKLPSALYKNTVNGKKFRLKLNEKLASLRIATMLDKLGIDSSRYLHSNNSVEIINHLNRCENCGEKKQCDDTIQQADATDIKEIDLSFCANIEDLKKEQIKQAY